MSVKLFKGDFVSYNWNDGLYEEKVRVANKYGCDAPICKVDNFSYIGEVKGNGIDKHIENRCSELQYNAPIGEIVRVGSPVKYIKLKAGFQDARLPQVVSLDLLSKTITGKANNIYIDRGHYAYMPLENKKEKKRYGLISVQGENVQYLLFANNLTEISQFVFSYLTNPNNNSRYYVTDYMSNKNYECYIKQDIVEKTTLKTTNSQTIVPLYRFVYYGYVKDDNT